MSVIRKEQTNITGGGGATKFEAPMTAQPNYWTVVHNLGTLSPAVFCWDEFNRVLTPWQIEVVDNMTVRVWFWNHYAQNTYRGTPAGKVAVI
jgi:hypothetical protein